MIKSEIESDENTLYYAANENGSCINVGNVQTSLSGYDFLNDFKEDISDGPDDDGTKYSNIGIGSEYIDGVKYDALSYTVDYQGTGYIFYQTFYVKSNDGCLYFLLVTRYKEDSESKITKMIHAVN